MHSFKHNKKKAVMITLGGIMVFAMYSMAVSFASEIHSQYASAQVVRTLEAQLKLSKSVVQAGKSQTATVTVKDQQSGEPVSGAQIQINLAYAGGAIVRQFNVISDDNGKGSVEIPINNNALSGQYTVNLAISAAGYASAGGFSLIFSVVDSNVDKGYSSSKDYHHNWVFNHHHKH